MHLTTEETLKNLLQTMQSWTPAEEKCYSESEQLAEIW